MNMRNRVQLIGRPGADPELKKLDNGNSVVNFSLATNESYSNSKGEKVDNTQWHNLVAWGKLAELVSKYVKKGKEVAVEGRMVTKKYEDIKGETKYISEVILSDLLLLGNK